MLELVINRLREYYFKGIKMRPEYINSNVRSRCPDCDGAITTFESQSGGSNFGSVTIQENHEFKEVNYDSIIYQLVKCAGCGRGGLAKIHYEHSYKKTKLESFFPISIEKVKIPEGVPEEIIAEFREAELCVSYEATRAASALFRSTLEKTLKANGYQKGVLAEKIDEAANDGIITEARRKKVHEDVRVLGNNILHEDWREIEEDEVEASHHYTQRILEDFYDDRESVESILIEKGKLKT